LLLHQHTGGGLMRPDFCHEKSIGGRVSKLIDLTEWVGKNIRRQHTLIFHEKLK